MSPPSMLRAGAMSAANAWLTRSLMVPSIECSLTRGRFQQFASPCDIGVQLPHQLFDAGERPGVAQTLTEFHGQLAAVQVALEAYQVYLDFARLFAESRVGANVGSAGPEPALVRRAYCIDAVTGNQRRD